MAELPERGRQHAGAIRVAAGQLARSIDDVLDMAQIDAGEMELSLGDVRLRDLFAEAVKAHRPRIEGRGATLKARVADFDAPPLSLLFDPSVRDARHDRSPEADEGIAAFKEKRKPGWYL
jgi:signal transduction histidine kinase